MLASAATLLLDKPGKAQLGTLPYSGAAIGSGPVTGFSQLKIGGGGEVTGISAANDGTLVCRTDVGGCYLCPSGTTKWQQLIVKSAWPAANFGWQNWTTSNGGVFAIAIAPSNSQVIYVSFQQFIFVSINGGASFTKTSCPQDTGADANGGGERANNHRLAVDPANPAIAIYGSTLGVYYTTNTGSTWNLIPVATIPAASPSGEYVAFDPSTTSGGSTPGIWIHSTGHGAYHGTGGVAGTWSGPTGQTTCSGLAVDLNGTVYLTIATLTTGVYVFSGGSWSLKTVPNSGGPTGVCADPNTAGRAVCVDQDGQLSVTVNSGSTWSDVIAANNHTYTVPAGQVTWIANYLAGGMTMFCFDCVFDPSHSNTLYCGQGNGVSVCAAPQTQPTAWVDQTLGIEELDATRVIAPPSSGKRVVSAWDHQGLVNTSLTTFPIKCVPNSAAGALLSAGWACDYASSDSANTFVILANFTDDAQETSGYSNDGGVTWTHFGSTSYYSSDNGGIAAADVSNFVVQSGDIGPFFTTNKGATWTACTGAPTSGYKSVQRAFQPEYLVADRVSIGTFYIFNPTNVNVYRSTNQGASFSLMGTPGGGIQNATKLKAVNGNAGHLFFTAGRGAGTTLRHSTDGGATWNNFGAFTEVECFGIGKAAAGQSYPSIYVYGTLTSSGVYGLFRCIDGVGTTWTLLVNGPPLGIGTSWVSSAEGDMDNYGYIYCSFFGNGYAYGYFP